MTYIYPTNPPPWEPNPIGPFDKNLLTCPQCGNLYANCTCTNTCPNTDPSGTITIMGNDPTYYWRVDYDSLIDGLGSHDLFDFLVDLPAEIVERSNTWVIFKSDTLPSLEHWREHVVPIDEISTSKSNLV